MSKVEALPHTREREQSRVFAGCQNACFTQHSDSDTSVTSPLEDAQRSWFCLGATSRRPSSSTGPWEAVPLHQDFVLHSGRSGPSSVKTVKVCVHKYLLPDRSCLASYLVTSIFRMHTSAENA
eukprot:jgi/Ulvmu1/11511/UM077_0060.1